MTKTNNIQLDFPITTVFETTLDCIQRGVKYVIQQGGTSSGKTRSIVPALIVNAAFLDPKSITTITGQSIPHLQDGAMNDMAEALDCSGMLTNQLKDFNQTKKKYTFKNGSVIQFKTYSDPQDAKSGKREYLFVNEGNGMPFSIFDKLDDRTKKTVIIDFNPDTPFWVHRRLLSKDTCERYISNAIEHNPFVTQTTIDKIKQKSAQDPNYNRVYNLGLTGRVQGLVFKKIKNYTEQPPSLKKEGYGLDFGFTNDPTALCHCGVSDNVLYGKQLIYQRGLTNDMLIKLMKELGVSRRLPIYADSADPKSIAAIRKGGFNVLPAPKGADSIRFGIDLLNGYESINIHSDSDDWIDESMAYKWAVDRKTGDNLNKPIDKHNHLWDSARYWGMGMQDYKKSIGGFY